mgnify:CR=1 FL=1
MVRAAVAFTVYLGALIVPDDLIACQAVVEVIANADETQTVRTLQILKIIFVHPDRLDVRQCRRLVLVTTLLQLTI